MSTNLADLVPAKVGEAAARAITERIAALSLMLSPSVTVALGDTGPEDLRATDLAATFWTLTRYAQHGVPVGDWVTDKDAIPAILVGAGAMFAAPGHPWNRRDLDAPNGVLAFKRGETPKAPILVLACAWARVRIAQGHAVPIGTLARLASVSDQRAHELAKAGAFKVTVGVSPKPTTVSAAEARRWLATRGLWPEK